jgi:hypothetical protein
MKKIALIGRSDLALKFSERFKDNTYEWFARPEYDVSDKNHCDLIVDKIGTPDVVLITPGIVNCDPWQSMLTNAVGPAYLTIQISKLVCKPHVIVLGSLGAEWRSWPGINLERLVYNNAKHMLASLVKDFYHSQINDCKLTILEPGRFISKMSSNSGTDIDNVVEMIHYAIDTPKNFNALHVQATWHKKENT